MNVSSFSGNPEDILPKIYFYCNECGNGHKLETWEIGLLCDYTNFFAELCNAISVTTAPKGASV